MRGSTSSNPATYVVVLRGPSGLHFGAPDGHFTLSRFPTGVGPVDLTFRTRRTQIPGFARPVRRGLVAEVRGSAPSLRDAIEVLANAARGVAVILALSANVPLGELTVELAYDSTQGRTERDFFQRFLPDEPLIPHPGRMVLAKEAGDVALAVAQHPDGDRIHRAIVHYAEALLRWEPGMEVLALASLWMGMESLTPVALRRELTSTGLTRDGRAQLWGVELKHLNAEVRRRLLFRLDTTTYRTAKNARDAFQHSFKAFATARADAIGVRNVTAEHLRAAILALADVDPATTAVLLASPFDRPIWWTREKYIFGRLIGTAEDLARPDQEYPVLRWASTPRELPADEYGDATFAFEESGAPWVAEGVRFELDRLELWGPQLDDRKAAGLDDDSSGEAEL